MEHLFKKLEGSYQHDKKHNLFITIIEGISAVLSGAFIHGLVAHSNAVNWLGAGVFSFLFLYLFYRSMSREINFSVSALGELKATIELDAAKKQAERKILIDGYIDDAIKALNLNTCNYGDTNVENHLCDQSLQLGLASVCQPYFTNPQNLLNSSKAKFTVGAYVNYFLKPGSPTVFPQSDYDMFIPRDDLNFKSDLSKDILYNSSLTHLPFIFQSQFADTFRHERFIHSTFNDGIKDYSLITASIPTVCEDGSLGVLFIIAEALDSIPADIENVTQIFCRLYTNWLTRYNECIISRHQKLVEESRVVKVPVAPVQNLGEQEQAPTNGSPSLS